MSSQFKHLNLLYNRSCGTHPDFDGSPAWSPDGDRIAFVSISGEISDLMVVNVDGTALDFLTFDENKDYDPAWSPDGTKIAFSKSDGEKRGIWIMNQDGTGAVNITNNPEEDYFRPAWSPDGSQIAFSAAFSEGGRLRVDIRVMNTDGTNEISLTKESQNLSPSWSSSIATLIESTSWGQIKALLGNSVPLSP